MSDFPVSKLLAGVSGARPANLDAVTRAIAGVSELAVELGEHIEVLDVNPLICGPDGAAVDAGSSAPNDPSCQLIAPAGSSA